MRPSVDAAAGDLADLGDLEDVEDLGAAGVVLLEDGLEEAVHGLGDLVLQLVDDGVQADLERFRARRLQRPCGRAGRLKPMTTAFEAEARRTSDSVMAPTPECRTRTRNLLGGHALERVGEDFRPSLARRP